MPRYTYPDVEDSLALGAGRVRRRVIFLGPPCTTTVGDWVNYGDRSGAWYYDPENRARVEAEVGGQFK